MLGDLFSKLQEAQQKMQEGKQIEESIYWKKDLLLNW